MRLARMHLANKNQDAARSSLRQALVAKPDLLPAQQALVGVELATARPDEALAIARTVQKQRPSEAVGFVMEAAIDTERNDLSAAANVYGAALRRFDSPVIAAKLHAVLVRAHRDTDAEKLAATWVKGHPNDAVFPSYLGELALEKKDHATAEKYFREVLRLQPANAQAMNNLAWTMAVLRKPGAADLAKKATALVPDAPDFLDTLAAALAAENQTAQAIDVQKKALALVPGNPMFRLRLAKLYIKAGDKATARTELETLAKLSDKFSGQAEVGELLKSL